MPRTDAHYLGSELAKIKKAIKDLQSGRLKNTAIDGGRIIVKDYDGEVQEVIGNQGDGSYGSRVTKSPPQPTPTAPDLTAKDLGALAVVWDGNTTDFELPLVHGHTRILFARSEDGSEPDISQYQKAPSTIRDGDGGGTTVVCSPPGTWFVRLQLVGQDRVTKGAPSAASSVEIEAKVDRQELIETIAEAQRLIDEARADLALGEEEREAKISELESRQRELTDNLASGLVDVANQAEDRAAELANDAVVQAASTAQQEYDRLQALADAARARAEEVGADQATTAAEVATARQDATAAQAAADAAQAKADAVETAQNTTAAEAEAARQEAAAARAAADTAQAKANAVETAQGSTAAATQAARDAADAAQAAAEAAQQKADALETAQGMTDAEVAAVKAEAEAAQAAAVLAQARADAAQARADELGALESGSILAFREEGVTGDSYIRMPALPGMGSSGNPDHESATVTLEWWALWDGTTPHAQSGMIMTASGPAHFELRSDSGQLRFRPGNVPSVAQVGSQIIPNEWTHFATVWDKPEGEFRVYIDGAHAETIGITETTVWGLASNWFVGYSTNGRTWSGRMRDVRVWNTARTAQQISQGRYSTPKADDPELEGWWSNFVGGRLVDSSANRRDSTLTAGGARAVASASAEVIRVIQELREAERAAEEARLAAIAAQEAAGNAQSTADLALNSANAKNRIFSSTSAPSGTAGNGDLWYRWSSTAADRRLVGIWVRESGTWRSMGTLDTTLIPLLDIGAGTFGDLSGDRLLAESVGVGVLDVVDIFGDSAVIAKIWTDIVRSRLVESVGIVTEDMVATESVTTPKLRVTEDMVAKFAQILHLVADQVEMNSFIAQSGMVGFLEAIGINLSDEAGGRRAEVSGAGIRVIDTATDMPQVQLGTFTDDLISLYDSADGNPVITLSQDGGLSAQALAVTRDPVFGGRRLAGSMYETPRWYSQDSILGMTGGHAVGRHRRGFSTDNSGNSGNGQQIIQMEFFCEPGRLYRIECQDFMMRDRQPYYLEAFYTTSSDDNVRPALPNRFSPSWGPSSGIIPSSGEGHGTTLRYCKIFSPATTRRVRVALVVGLNGGGDGTLRFGSGQASSADLVVTDIGPNLGSTGHTVFRGAGSSTDDIPEPAQLLQQGYSIAQTATYTLNTSTGIATRQYTGGVPRFGYDHSNGLTYLTVLQYAPWSQAGVPQRVELGFRVRSWRTSQGNIVQTSLPQFTGTPASFNFNQSMALENMRNVSSASPTFAALNHEQEMMLAARSSGSLILGGTGWTLANYPASGVAAVTGVVARLSTNVSTQEENSDE